MLNFHLEAYSAIAPSLASDASWQQWFASPTTGDFDDDLLNIKQVPPMLRRRFKRLGKTASVAALNILNNEDIPSIFASRHGDTELTLSLLQDIAKNEPVSPAGFSLAVHNAVGGLLSIVRKDKSPMTAISCQDGLVINSLLELTSQFALHERVLCVLYDIPLPAFYQPYARSLPFPVAIAFIANQTGQGTSLSIEYSENKQDEAESDNDILAFAKLISGYSKQIQLSANKQLWAIRRHG